MTTDSDARLEDLMKFAEFFLRVLRGSYPVLANQFICKNGEPVEVEIIFDDPLSGIRYAYLSRAQDFDYPAYKEACFISADFSQSKEVRFCLDKPDWAYFAILYERRRTIKESQLCPSA